MIGREPDCHETFVRLLDQCGFLTGFTRRATAALIHLREAWIAADQTNRPGIETAIRSVMATRSILDRRDEYRDFLVDGLDDASAAELWEIATKWVPR